MTRASGMLTLRRSRDGDAPMLWALNALDTANNQPEAMAFYRSLGYREVGREHRPEWAWTLVYYARTLEPAPESRRSRRRLPARRSAA